MKTKKTGKHTQKTKPFSKRKEGERVKKQKNE